MRLTPILASLLFIVSALAAEPTPSDARAAMRKASEFFRSKIAVHGGYVYYVSPDLSRRLGEGVASPQQIWVQPPGTPAVGLSFLAAFAATGDEFYLDAAREAAEALVYGQLKSGGWANAIDFDPRSPHVAQYRNGKGGGKNNSTLDDGISQNALRLLMHADRALGFKHAAIHEASEIARKALLAAQFSSGGFPQVWIGPVAPHEALKAQYPDYEWRTENRIKNYWDMPTLNDDLVGHVVSTLADAVEIYKDDRCGKALARLGDFLILAQMPDPQPAWAQQYDTHMRPIWARKFEPPAIAGRESQDAIESLLRIYRFTGDRKYLEPIPRALAYLRKSLLPDGRLARYRELKTDRPLYMTSKYELTYDDADVPTHYGWKTAPRLDQIEADFKTAQSGAPAAKSAPPDAAAIRKILGTLDSEGRWLVKYSGQPLVGQPKFKDGEVFISSEEFSKNLNALSEFVRLRAP